MWMIRLRTLLKSVGREFLVLLFALRHPATPRGLKLAIVALLLYVLSPVDLIPDLLPIVGWADDAVVVVMATPYLVRRLPARVMADCSAAAARLLARFGIHRS